VIFERASRQLNNVQHLNAAASSQDYGPGFGGDDLFGDEINAWQKLQDSQFDDDLASIFQDELELKDVFPGLNEGRIATEEILEQDRQDAKEHENDINEEVFSQITFSLRPHSNHHFLHGQIRDDLQNWITIICDQYRWELDFLSIRPERLCWRLRDFPESLIHEMYRIVRERTSERLFYVFPELEARNVSGDFWSPDYYVDAEKSIYP
jgi:REP element-mobilizing transposase RayT